MSKILGVMLTVADIKTMTQFFVEVLSFKKMSMFELPDAECSSLFGIKNMTAELVMLILGDEKLYLIEFKPHGKPYPQINSNNLIFQHIAIVVSDLDKAYQLLLRYHISGISAQPITIPEWNHAAAGIRAYYFRSPEGHPLELIYFPKGKGKEIWHNNNKLFLGVDHTAIAIANTDKSLRFYRDKLGMKILGESLNYGETQENLSGVPGAKVRITGLGYPDSHSMGLEFLDYLHPATKHAEPQLSTNDLGCTYTVIQVDKLPSLEKLCFNKGRFITDMKGDAHAALLVRDIDRHHLILVN